MGKEKLNLACIASGSGTDFESIAKAWLTGHLSEIDSIFLISTNPRASCLEKAQYLGIESMVVDYAKHEPTLDFSEVIALKLQEYSINLVFLVGCIHKIYPLALGIPVYNIHPAEPREHGGDNMYALAVHTHVLNEITDLINRGRANINQRFFTYPTVHEVEDLEYDSGEILLQQAVEIPSDIITDYVEAKKDGRTVAERLQKHVLPYEWLMLPTAVKIAAKILLDEGR